MSLDKWIGRDKSRAYYTGHTAQEESAFIEKHSGRARELVFAVMGVPPTRGMVVYADYWPDLAPEGESK